MSGNFLSELTLLDLINLIANIQQLRNDQSNATNNDIMKALQVQNKQYLEQILERLDNNDDNKRQTEKNQGS